MNSTYWIKTSLILFILLAARWAIPQKTIDPWNIFNLKKLVTIILALASIQAIGSISIWILGPRMSAMFTGFLGGLISSTATTASLSRQSVQTAHSDASTEALIFLWATLAMLFEAAAITVLGTTEVHLVISLVFSGPIVATLALILIQGRSAANKPVKLTNINLDILPLIKLSAFIIGVLTLSKALQKFLGQAGLLAITFLVSLFEIHGAVIANMQLHDAHAIGVRLFGSLIAISILAAYLSKLFLVLLLGSKPLKAMVRKFTVTLFFSLVVGWIAFQYFVSIVK